jgi:putative nucleotidyltransferase with HDIG domain
VLRAIRHNPLLLALLAASATLPAAAVEGFATTPAGLSGVAHFWLALAGGSMAAAASVALTLVGVRRRDGRSVLLGCAFSTMTAMLAVHGLATPGVLVGPNGVVALAGGASLPAGAAVLALSALPAMRRSRRIRAILVLQAALAVGVLVVGALGLLWPALVPATPATGSRTALVLLAVGLAAYALLAHRALRTFALTHRRGDLVVAVGCAWLGVALIPQMTIVPGSIGFYLGHVLELAGVALVGIPASLDLAIARGGASRALVGDLSATEIVAAEEAYLGSRVRALMVRLAEKDTSTEQHTRRVALLAVEVGERMALPPATLRSLAVGGLLHDIGKLSVPTEILQKPGRLDEAEYAEIKRHPVAGVQLLRELGGFPDPVHRLVAEHHERLDGKGYPDGLTAPDIGVGSRVLAVCDVYDALVSDRVYREAWTPERALSLLREEAGTAFDPGCVEALAAVVAEPRTAPESRRVGAPLGAARPAVAGR